MTIVAVSETRDCLRRFLFEQFSVRGQLVHLDAAWQAVLERYDYPPVVRSLLGEAMAATVLLAATIKFDGVLSLQLESDGPLKFLVVQCTNTMNLRGLARWDGEVPKGSLADVAPGGRMTIAVETCTDNSRYQGIVPIEDDSLSRSIQAYFETSEQLPTRLWLAANSSAAVGLLLQRLPDKKGEEREYDDNWPRVQLLADTVKDEELLDLSQEAVLRRLFAEEDVRLFAQTPVAFRCSCTKDRVESVLKMLGAEDIKQLAEQQGDVQVRCQFCNQAYTFDTVDVESLFTTEAVAPASTRKH
ncbi:MAG: Hsp33 family molecular chaperone HslO [Gammaproteobacteria bacterium]